MAKRKSSTKKAVEKAARSNPKAFIIAIVAIVVIIAIAVAVLYFAFPETWNELMVLIGSFTQDEPEGPSFEPLTRGEGELMVHFIDIGQGDCIYIVFPDGKDMLIDCGNDGDSAHEEEALAYLDAYITDDTLDYLMLTHTDKDHVAFLDIVLDTYQVNTIYMPNVLASKDTYQSQIATLDTSMFQDKDTIDTIVYADFFVRALSEPNCNVVLNMDEDKTSNTIIIEETTYRLVFYCPTEEYYDSTGLSSAERKNALSPIGILEYNGRKIMFTGDSNEYNEPLVMERTGAMDLDVLKVGHHGSKSSTSEEFLANYNFEYAIISCDMYDNSYNHPRQATLDRLAAEDIEVYRTDNNGNIVLTVDADGNIKFTLETEVTQAKNLEGLPDPA